MLSHFSLLNFIFLLVSTENWYVVVVASCAETSHLNYNTF